MLGRLVAFRADDGVMAALAERAQREGVSVSEVIRDTLCERVAPGAEDAAASDGGRTMIPTLDNPFVQLKAAAAGDLEAQRLLAMEAVRLVGERNDLDPVSVLLEGLPFARLASCHGDDGDKGLVLSMLSLAREFSIEAGDSGTADEFTAEAIARVSLLAEAGVQIADANLDLLIENASPDVLVMAKDYERRMRAAGGV
jgi:hypothetical protein